MQELIGKTIGQYQIVEKIGQGGMAAVYRAFQPSMNRYVAIKVLSQALANDKTFVQRFRQEAQAIAQGGPNALAEAKRLIRIVSRTPMDEAFGYAEGKIAELFASAEAAEGMASFVTKRKPEWAK